MMAASVPSAAMATKPIAVLVAMTSRSYLPTDDIRLGTNERTITSVLMAGAK